MAPRGASTVRRRQYRIGHIKRANSSQRERRHSPERFLKTPFRTRTTFLEVVTLILAARLYESLRSPSGGGNHGLKHGVPDTVSRIALGVHLRRWQTIY